MPSLLFGSALVLFFVGLVVPPHHPRVEGLAVMVAVILATGVAFLSEYKSDREFEVLNAHKDSLRVKVHPRRRSSSPLPLEEVVVGDVVVLETGDEIPADGRLAQGDRAVRRSVADDRRVGAGRKQAAARRRHRRRPGPARLPLPRHAGRRRRRADDRHRGRRRDLPRPDRPPAVGGRGRGGRGATADTRGDAASSAS